MVKIKKWILPNDVAKHVVYGFNNQKKTITVHQTGNTSKGADAKAHAKLQLKGNSRNASWHYQVDNLEIIQSFEDDAQCFHAGDGRGPGNLNSIAVELCINSDGDYKKTLENGAELVRYLMDKYNLSINDVKQHYNWSGKNCPAQIRANKDGISWSDFLKMVKSSGKQMKPSTVKPSSSKPKSKSTYKTATAHVGMRVESKVNNLRYYSKPSWDDKDVVGHVDKGIGFPKITAKYKVEDGYQYQVQNSKGNTYYITASTKYVDVISGKKASSKKPSSKSISQMADEVIRGLHGNGHDERRKSLGISEALYEKVRAEVNRRL